MKLEDLKKLWNACFVMQILKSFIKPHMFQQFERVLTTDQKELFLDELLTAEDCKFLKSIAIPFSKNSPKLDMSSFTKEDIHGYGIVFKVLSGMNLNSI